MNVISPHKLVMLFTGRIQSNVNQEQIKQISLRAKRRIIITSYAVDFSFIDVSRDVVRILHKARKKHKHKQPKNKTTSKNKQTNKQNKTNTNKTNTSIFPQQEVTFIYSTLCLKDKSKLFCIVAQLIAQTASCFQYKLNCERAHIGVCIVSTTTLL